MCKILEEQLMHDAYHILYAFPYPVQYLASLFAGSFRHSVGLVSVVPPICRLHLRLGMMVDELNNGIVVRYVIVEESGLLRTQR